MEKDYFKKYYKKNKSKLLKKQNKYYEKNKDKRLEYQSDYYKKNKDNEKKRIRKWIDDNKEHFNQLMRINYERSKVKHLARIKAYKINIPNILCQICNKNKAKERHHKDHSKPLDVLFVCKQCNINLKY